MAVKRRKVDTAVERNILIGMIVSDRFIKEIIPMYSPDLMEIEYAPIVAKWCIDYFNQYEKAIGLDIQDVFDGWRKRAKNEEQETFIEKFLMSLSEEFEHADKFNVDYLLDKAVMQFKKKSLKNLAEDISYSLEQDALEDAELVLQEFRKVEKLTNTGIDPYDDQEAIQSAFESKQEPLFKIPGTLGRLVNDDLTRDSFITLMGPEKSFWLMYFAMQAHRGRCNVALFSVGDMSEAQMVRRQHISLSKKSDLKKYCGELKIPVLDCENNQKDTCTLRIRTSKFGCYEDGEIMSLEDAQGYVPCTACARKRPKDFKGAVWHTLRPEVDPLTWREAFKAGQEYKKKVRAKGFKLATFPNDSISVTGIRNVLDMWERTEGFIPDVVVIDYADILMPERLNEEFRHQENTKWKALRRMSQELHICLITATQTNRESYDVKNIELKHAGEDKRKFAHVTAAYALNQTNDEQQAGIMRIAPLVVREDAYNTGYNVHVLQCLQIGSPYISSY